MTARLKQIYFRSGIEPFVWIAALLYLGLSTPTENAHFTICPLAYIGIVHCPGCGLGHSVSYALHGDLPRSFHAHMLGVPAILILTARIASIFKNVFRHHPQPITTNNRSSHAQCNAVDADT